MLVVLCCVCLLHMFHTLLCYVCMCYLTVCCFVDSLNALADAESEDDFNNAFRTLTNSTEWQQNINVQQWFTTKWLPQKQV